MVVKIQIPLATNTEPLALIYNKDRTFETYSGISTEIKKVMKGRPKAFFKVKIVKTVMRIGDEVSDPGW